MSVPSYNSLKLTLTEVAPNALIAEVGFNRSDKLNAMHGDIWAEVPTCMEYLSNHPEVRAVILYGEGRCFSAGLDLQYAASKIFNNDESDATRVALGMQGFIGWLQDSCSSLERCRKPVIAATHNLTIGGAFEMILAADIRICTQDCTFNLKEIELGFASDLGGIQRLSAACGNQSWVREILFTGRTFTAAEAEKNGVVSQVVANYDDLRAEARRLATDFARKSPVALVSTKYALLHARKHGVESGLEMQRVWNAMAIQSIDVKTAIAAGMQKNKKPATFAKL